MRYSQGLTIQDDVYYYRYGFERIKPNLTDFDFSGSIDILDSKNLNFIVNDSIQSEID
ncbi:MAG: hypothetical protein R2879_04400 [Saprospiraceae bacterium]